MFQDGLTHHRKSHIPQKQLISIAMVTIDFPEALKHWVGVA